jgi:phosphate transport system substrate-binding protein
MKRLVKYSLIIGLLLASVGLVSRVTAADRLTLSGSTTVLPIAQKAAEEFMKQNPSVDVSVRGGGSGVGIAAIIDGTVDIGDSSRAAKNKEIANAKAKAVSMVGNIVARDGICIIVNKANSIKSITIDTANKIYRGEINKWSDVGGNAGVIVPISRDTSSGTYEVFNEKILKGAKVREDALMLASNQAILTTVANTPGAIGYVGLGYVTDEIKALVVNDVIPSKETVINGTYPIARPLYMYTNGAPKGLTKQFIDFVLSPTGQQIVESVGFVAVK